MKKRVSKRLTRPGGVIARDQEQAGGIRQQSRIRKRLPGAGKLRRLALVLTPEAETGFLAGLADRGDRKRFCTRGFRLRAALEQIGLKLRRDRRRAGHAIVVLVDAATGEDELARHEHHLVVALADQDFWNGAAAINEDQGGSILWPKIRMVVGFLFFVDFFRCRLRHVRHLQPQILFFIVV